MDGHQDWCRYIFLYMVMIPNGGEWRTSCIVYGYATGYNWTIIVTGSNKNN